MMLEQSMSKASDYAAFSTYVLSSRSFTERLTNRYPQVCTLVLSSRMHQPTPQCLSHVQELLMHMLPQHYLWILSLCPHISRITTLLVYKYIRCNLMDTKRGRSMAMKNKCRAKVVRRKCGIPPSGARRDSRPFALPQANRLLTIVH